MDIVSPFGKGEFTKLFYDRVPLIKHYLLEFVHYFLDDKDIMSSITALIPALMPAKASPANAPVFIPLKVRLSIIGTTAMQNPVRKVTAEDIKYLFMFWFIFF